MNMKLKYEEVIRCHPAVIIAPNDKFDFPNATITVRFFQYDDEGMLMYKPFVMAGVSFEGIISPESAENWGDCLKNSALIAQGGIPNYIESEFKNEVVEAFLKVKEVREANGI